MSARDAGRGPMSSFIRRIHFVGVGGVGMSGIAEVLGNLGYAVSGSDAKASAVTQRLSAQGVKIFIGHAAAHAEGAQVVVVSSAVPQENPEVSWARRQGVPVILRAQMLAELGRMKKTVTVAGSHGKTTTTSMVAMALSAAGARPTMIIGGQLKNIGASARLGVGDYMVAEADESDGSFRFLTPLAAVVTNVDNDHLDYHKSMDNLRQAFVDHLHRLPFYGAAVLCGDDAALRSLFPRIQRPMVSYGFSPANAWTARAARLSKDGSRFDACLGGRRMASVSLRVAGRHNVLNALAALAAGHFLGFAPERLAGGLSRFKGVSRRLDRLGRAAGVEFIDDYGHHPTEIEATLAAVSGFWKARRVVAIFQPHRYSRTKLLAKEFGPALRKADFVFVTDIYPAGEKPLRGVSRELILHSLRKSGVACAPFEGAGSAVRQLREGDVVVTLGAGDVWKFGADLLRRLTDGLASPA